MAAREYRVAAADFHGYVWKGEIDFDKLKQVLGEYVDDEKERYNFTWNSKGKILNLAHRLLLLWG